MARIQESGEMYLETILILSQKGPVRAIDVGEEMGYSKPSVSRAMSLLKKDGYVTVDGEGHLLLTDAGRRIAERGNRLGGRLPDRALHQRRNL